MFEAADTLHDCVRIASGVLCTLRIDPDRMRSGLSADMLATDLAEYLVRKGAWEQLPWGCWRLIVRAHSCPGGCWRPMMCALCSMSWTRAAAGCALLQCRVCGPAGWAQLPGCGPVCACIDGCWYGSAPRQCNMLLTPWRAEPPAGVPFRETHHISGAAVKLAEDRGCELSALSVADLQGIHPLFGEDVVEVRRGRGNKGGRLAAAASARPMQRCGCMSTPQQNCGTAWASPACVPAVRQQLSPAATRPALPTHTNTGVGLPAQRGDAGH